VCIGIITRFSVGIVFYLGVLSSRCRPRATLSRGIFVKWIVITRMDVCTRRTTRASLSLEKALVTKVGKKKRSKKNVKFEDATDVENKRGLYLSTSLISDEGIDMAFSPILCTILKPRHPLPHSWTFWYSAGDKRLSWKKNQKKISSVETIEDFWLTYNQVKLASSLPAGFTYSVFRTGILPDWQDVANRDGGRWMVSFGKEERKEMLDNRWLEVLYMLLGEQAEGESSSVVTGAEACVRKKGDRLELWLGNVASMACVVKVGRKLKDKVKSDIQLSIHSEEKEGVEGSKLML